jgi:hypothetical protein
VIDVGKMGDLPGTIIAACCALALRVGPSALWDQRTTGKQPPI